MSRHCIKSKSDYRRTIAVLFDENEVVTEVFKLHKRFRS